MTQLTVLNPMGYPPKVTKKALAPRLSTLDGKTIYLVDCRFDDSDIFLKQVAANSVEHIPVSGVPAGSTVNLRAVTADGTRTYTKSNVTLSTTMYDWRLP